MNEEKEITTALDEEMVEMLLSLKDDEKIDFAKDNKEFVIINKSNYVELQCKSTAFDLINKLDKGNRK